MADRLEILGKLQEAMASVEIASAESRIPVSAILETADPEATRDLEEKLMAGRLSQQILGLMLNGYDIERTWVEEDTEIKCQLVVMPKSTATFINSCIISLMARERGESFN